MNRWFLYIDLHFEIRRWLNVSPKVH
jgi:hypothetical protein